MLHMVGFFLYLGKGFRSILALEKYLWNVFKILLVLFNDFSSTINNKNNGQQSFPQKLQCYNLQFVIILRSNKCCVYWFRWIFISIVCGLESMWYIYIIHCWNTSDFNIMTNWQIIYVCKQLPYACKFHTLPGYC